MCATTAQMLWRKVWRTLHGHEGESWITAKGDLKPPHEALRLAAQEMGVGPPDSGCRTGVQTTGSCCGPMAVVVSVSVKGAAMTASGEYWKDEYK